MKNLEDILFKQSEELNKLEAPDNLESRLSQALQIRRESKRRPWIKAAAVIIAALLFISYNYSALAFYGKQFLGFEQVMRGTLQELNELGKGQAVGKSYTFKNGVVITLDGIMVDANQLIAFYTTYDEQGRLDDIYVSSDSIAGLVSSWHSEGGQGNSNLQWTERKSIAYFEPPGLLSKNLTMNFSMRGQGNKYEQGEISFSLDRNKAMSYVLEHKLDSTVEVADTTLRFNTLQASPTVMLLKGQLQLGQKLSFGATDFDISVLVNGQKLSTLGGGLSSNRPGVYDFTKEFDALPSNAKTIEVVLVNCPVIEGVEVSTKLFPSTANKEILINGNEVMIDKVVQQNGKTYVTIVNDYSVEIPQLWLQVGGEAVSIEDVTDIEDTKTKEGIFHRKTLVFDAVGENMFLEIGSIAYLKTVNETVKVIEIE